MSNNPSIFTDPTGLVDGKPCKNWPPKAKELDEFGDYTFLSGSWKQNVNVSAKRRHALDPVNYWRTLYDPTWDQEHYNEQNKQSAQGVAFNQGDAARFAAIKTRTAQQNMVNNEAGRGAQGGNYRNLSNPKQYPGISIYQNNNKSDLSAVTLPGFGIYIGGGYKGVELTKVIQHEYGHYLDYKFSLDLNFNGQGFTNFYLMIGVPSLFNAATGIGGSHISYWTEKRANGLAEIWFGKDYVRDPYVYPTK